MRLPTVLAAAVIFPLAALAAPAQAQLPPDIPLPNLPKPDEVAKFQMTVSGLQTVSVDYKWEPPAGVCQVILAGSLTENWRYERGRRVEIVFRRYGNNVFVSRQGRRIGDLAFGTTGSLHRYATGSLNEIGPRPACRGYRALNDEPDCGKEFKVRRNLRLNYQAGVMTVESSEGGGSIPSNPASGCGNDTDVLSPEYPTFIKGKSKLTRARIFGSKKGIRLDLKGRAIQPLEPAYVTVNGYSGQSVVELTLTRIR